MNVPDAVPRDLGLLLAAGAGTRMGGRKPLVRHLPDTTLLEQAMRALADGGCWRLVVVVGADQSVVTTHAREIAQTLTAPVDVVVNPDWPDGQATSLRRGLTHCATLAADRAVLHLVDLPRIGPTVVARLLAVARQSPQDAVVATYQGHQRNPVVLPSGMFAQVADAARGDHGARGWLRAHPQSVREVPCDDIGSPEDIDTSAELAAYRQQASQQSPSS